MGTGNSDDLIRQMEEYTNGIKKNKKEDEDEDETEKTEDFKKKAKIITDIYKIRNIGDPPRNKTGKSERKSIQERNEEKHQKFEEDMKIGKSEPRIDMASRNSKLDFGYDLGIIKESADMYEIVKDFITTDFSPGIELETALTKLYRIKGTGSKQGLTGDSIAGIDKAGVFKSDEEMRAKMTTPTPIAEIPNSAKNYKKECDQICTAHGNLIRGIKNNPKKSKELLSGYQIDRLKSIEYLKHCKMQYELITGRKYSHPDLKLVLGFRSIRHDMSVGDMVEDIADSTIEAILDKIGDILRTMESALKKNQRAELTKRKGVGDFFDLNANELKSGFHTYGWKRKEDDAKFRIPIEK